MLHLKWMKKVFLFFILILLPLFFANNAYAHSDHGNFCALDFSSFAISENHCDSGSLPTVNSNYGYPYCQCTPSASPTPPTNTFRVTYCNDDLSGILTAIGCIPVRDVNNFVPWMISWFIGISGGIAFIFILVASFKIMTASGNQEQLQGGRELLTAALSGLILIIFSIFLLRLIGVGILGIPGLQ